MSVPYSNILLRVLMAVIEESPPPPNYSAIIFLIKFIQGINPAHSNTRKQVTMFYIC